MTCAVLTASANHHGIKDHPVWHEDADYYCFSDNPPTNSRWNVGQFYDFSLDPTFRHRRNAKIYKILSFLFVPNYDYYIWVDCTHTVKLPPTEIIETYLWDADIAVFRHPERDCVYQEAEKVKQLNYDHHSRVDIQTQYYRQQGHPEHYGLYELPAFVYRNTPRIRALMLNWWEHISRFSSRDQISFPYLCRDLKIVPSIIPGRARDFNDVLPCMWRI